jgi:hypothetical protein
MSGVCEAELTNKIFIFLVREEQFISCGHPGCMTFLSAHESGMKKIISKLPACYRHASACYLPDDRMFQLVHLYLHGRQPIQYLCAEFFAPRQKLARLSIDIVKIHRIMIDYVFLKAECAH